MSVEFDRGSPGEFDSRTLSRKTLNRWTGRNNDNDNDNDNDINVDIDIDINNTSHDINNDIEQY